MDNYVARLAQSVERETFIHEKELKIHKEEISRPRVRAPYRASFFFYSIFFLNIEINSEKIN
jgi:hypothetical protein